MSAAGRFPKWALLELDVFLRDDDDSFPDESDAPVRASATTSWGAPFRIAFSIAEPPLISRLYAQMSEPGIPPGKMGAPMGIYATQRHLALLGVTNDTLPGGLVQNFFIFRANQSNPSESSLQLLPPCTEPKFDYHGGDIRRRPSDDDATPRLLNLSSLALWCGDEEDFVVVAELSLYIPSQCRHTNKHFANICMFRGNSCTSSSADDDHNLAAGRWMSMRMEILSTPEYPAHDECQWGIETAVGFQRWLCWIDYHRGILFCDMSSKLPTPSLSFLRFPLHRIPPTSTATRSSCLYSGVSVVHHGRALKFVNVTHLETLSGEPKPGTGFIITCHTLVLGGVGGMAWEKDYTVTSDDLWDHANNLPDSLQCGTLKFPRVDVERPHIVHFLSAGFVPNKQKMWVVSIDMSTNTVESSHLYINARESFPARDAFFIVKKVSSPTPFLPCEFPRFCYSSSSRGKDSFISDSPMTITFGEFNIHVKHGNKAEEMMSEAVSSSVLPCNLIFKGVNLLKKEEKKAKKYIIIGSMAVEIG